MLAAQLCNGILELCNKVISFHGSLFDISAGCDSAVPQWSVLVMVQLLFNGSFVCDPLLKELAISPENYLANTDFSVVL